MIINNRSGNVIIRARPGPVLPDKSFVSTRLRLG